jgi:hypothetical protein
MISLVNYEILDLIGEKCHPMDSRLRETDVIQVFPGSEWLGTVLNRS